MRLGIDVGSTTVKTVVLDDQYNVLHTEYRRHYSKIADTLADMLARVRELFPAADEAYAALSGSAGLGLAERADLPFVQEVHATRLAAERFTPGADVVIELGGEDAKLLFLSGLYDARMNGSCAGGTGAFIDQMATLLKIDVGELNERARAHRKVYSIASRCGVFAKTDVQPLLNQGATVEDISASILYSVVNQTISGLAQGRKIEGSVVYLGGPLTFMSELRRAFDHVLGLTGKLPEHSLYFVSIGAALYAGERIALSELSERIGRAGRAAGAFSHTAPLFRDEAEYAAFRARHARARVPVQELALYRGRAHLGIDAGSTTVKTALISESGSLLHTTYHQGGGNPVPIVRQDILDIYEACPDIEIASATVTGYGEELIREAFRADFGVVETVAHFTAARRFNPDVDFIIDIGGQDMKCFKVEHGAISDIFLNEACSSGCGSFLQTFAETLGEDIRTFSRRGLFADAPVDLGSRCTVFMNSSVKQAQKDGASIENVSAGLAISVVKNAIYKVIRASDPAALGRNIVVQGGTFYNDAVLRAFELEMGAEVIRPDIAGLMGAYGAALYGLERRRGDYTPSSLLGADAVRALTHTVKTAGCGLCTNNCLLTVNTFSGGRKYISGNRCERPLAHSRKAVDGLDLYEYKQTLLERYQPEPGKRGVVGLPLALNFYEMLPFWHTILTRLGYEVRVSPRSSRKLYFKGQATIPSDTVCYPAKLAHGHIAALLEDPQIDTVFYPCMTYNIDEKLGDNHFNCPVVAYYPEVIRANCEALRKKAMIFAHVGIHRPRDFKRRLWSLLRQYAPDLTKREVSRAVDAGYAEYGAHLARIRAKGAEIIARARAEGRQIVVLAGRPYHIDNEINHGINKLITGYGAAIISEDCISHLTPKQHTNILNQWTYHARLFSAARYICDKPDMQLVQLVSFGCGLDAVTTDEVREILHRSGKLCTQIKIDEIGGLGAVNIRLRSMFAALEQSRPAAPHEPAKRRPEAELAPLRGAV